MLRTLKLRLILLVSTLLTGACATSVPVAVSCPKPPPVPQVLLQPVSTEKPLIVLYQDLIKELQDLLKKATTQ